MAVRKEIREVEKQLEKAQHELDTVTERLKKTTDHRLNIEEELLASNVRLKQLIVELKEQKAKAPQQSAEVLPDGRITVNELSRKVETTLMKVLEERFNDEAFTAAISEQSAISASDKVRVEYEGDEAFWAIRDHYTFEMLLADAARYWDLNPRDAVLNDGEAIRY